MLLLRLFYFVQRRHMIRLCRPSEMCCVKLNLSPPPLMVGRANAVAPSYFKEPLLGASSRWEPCVVVVPSSLLTRPSSYWCLEKCASVANKFLDQLLVVWHCSVFPWEDRNPITLNVTVINANEAAEGDRRPNLRRNELNGSSTTTWDKLSPWNRNISLSSCEQTSLYKE